MTSSVCVAVVPQETMSENIQKQAATEEKKETKKDDSASKETIDPQTPEEKVDNLRVLIIGDSVALGADWRIIEAFPRTSLDAAKSRQATVAIDIVNNALANNWDYEAVVFSLGTNGPLQNSLADVKSAIPEGTPMFVLSLKAPYESWADDNNAKIRDFCDNNKNVYLIDWENYSNNHPDWFYSDETHLTQEGGRWFAAYIKQCILEVYKTKSN